ncbi:MAG: GNAT family N-acetyltransferase [Oscillospiraceae bacterium]|nr:GNAT family N-acetyltransferase [Oscillospiraceae bacterium]
MDVSLLPAYDSPDEVRALFSEYTQMLIEGDPVFEEFLAIQNYDDELKKLHVKYGLPGGRLYLARSGGAVAGCIALHKLDDTHAEIKRLYVRPQYRRHHIASLLVEQVLQDARDIGYDYIQLDTLPFLTGALRLYESFGFTRFECENNSPMKESIFMKLDL